MKSAAATAALYRFISLTAVHWHAAVISAHCFEKSRHTLLVFRSKVAGNQWHHAQTNTNTDIERQSLHLQLDPDSCQIDIAMRRCKHIAGSSRDTDAEDRSQFFLWQYRTNELVRRRMNFSSDAMADFEGLLEVNRKICKQQMTEKASPTLPTNCAVLP